MTTIGLDGYPLEWHTTIKHRVREEAGFRCVRCKHPYRSGEHGKGEWTPCDDLCTHEGPVRVLQRGELVGLYEDYNGGLETARAGWEDEPDVVIEAQWRILTVHHLDHDKTNCKWWNLAALCQRCHLTIQGRVFIERAFLSGHTEWFKPYAAGWYALKYEDKDITRAEAEERLEELLAYERLW